MAHQRVVPHLQRRAHEQVPRGAHELGQVVAEVLAVVLREQRDVVADLRLGQFQRACLLALPIKMLAKN